jgi:ATP-binding cassette, subfamily G (WHITE), member 2, PDR
VQQQDVHLETATVREALYFSAMLRQPKSASTEDRCRHVEDVIRVNILPVSLILPILIRTKMLDMNEFAEAVVGIPGEGLNVEQRKLLSIGVELAAKPALLLFLDEPTSGLDSQSSLAIVSLLRKLADHGQAVLSTIHQPSSILFEEFDQLLFLAKGGRTVYFGEIGHNSQTLLDYFKKHGARSCGKSENPAEYILEIVTARESGQTRQDWPEMWKSSDESRSRIIEQDRIQHEMGNMATHGDNDGDGDEFAVPLYIQLRHTIIRIFQQYWRSPSYIWGKIMLSGVSAL